MLLPGVYRLEEGDRVIDAVVAAGGISPNADLSSVNLSRRVEDEAHYHIPAVATASTDTSPDSSSATPGSRGLIDVNTASTGELEILPEIGPSLAGAIVSYRNETALSIPSMGWTTCQVLAPRRWRPFASTPQYPAGRSVFTRLASRPNSPAMHKKELMG